MSAPASFLAALSQISGTGSFHSQGKASFFLPVIVVDGIGEIAFPLPASQAKEIIAVAEAAPYGKGTATVFDQAVRKCWQVDASQISIQCAEWQKFLAKTLESVRGDLGISGKISAHPYKLLVYGKGGHFKAHRDSEKLDAMFGTLIIALPSAHEGGRLFIRHDGRELVVDFSEKEHLHEFQHAAFFADCEHEVEPVRSGYRCCLVYNLRLDEGDPAALNLPLDAHAKTLIAPLSTMKGDRSGELAAILLEHSYTEANFSLRNLKGNDQARARALLAAARETGFTARIGLFTHHLTGQLEESGYRRKRRHWEDEDDVDPVDGTMGEIYDESRSIDQWRDPLDRSVPLGTWHITEDSIITLEEFDNAEPDEKEAEGYTGNAGCTMDYWYRRAAVVLWPKEDDEKILCQYDFAGACGTLASMVSDPTEHPGPGFERLANAVVSLMPDKSPAGYRHRSQLQDHPFHIILESLAKAGSRDLLEKLLSEMPEETWVLCDAPLWEILHKTFGIDVFQDLHNRMLVGDADASRHILFPLLDALLAHKDGESIAHTIAVRLAALKPKAPIPYGWSSPPPQSSVGDRNEARILLSASHLLAAPNDRKSAFRFLLADQSLDYLRQVLAPVLLGTDNPRCLSASLFAELHEYTKESLAAEVARPLPPFPDWTRPCPIPGSQTPLRMGSYPTASNRESAALHDLATFMADPAAKTREFRYAEAIRNSLQSFIRTHALDLDHTTIRKGSPHALACTKNENSHHRNLARRAEDAKLLADLTKARPTDSSLG